MGWKRAPLNGVADARDGKETLGAPVVRTARSSVRCGMEWSIVLDLLGWSEPAFRTLCVFFPRKRDAGRFVGTKLTGRERAEQKECCDKFVTSVTELLQS